jgi:hypothetical protein
MKQNRQRTDEQGNSVINVLLSTIPVKECQFLKPHLSHVRFLAGQNLEEPGNEIEAACFINSGLLSLVVSTKSGRTVEVGVAGMKE